MGQLEIQKKENTILKTSLAVALFLELVFPYLKSIPVNIIIFSLFLFLIHLVQSGKIFIPAVWYNKKVKLISKILLILTSLSIISLLVNQTYDFYWLMYLLKIIVAFGITGFYIVRYRNILTVELIYKVIIIVAFINSLFVVYQLLIGLLDINLPSFIMIEYYTDEYYEEAFRKPGILASYVSTSMLSFIAFALLNYVNKALFGKWVKIIVSLFLITSIFTSGRTGLYIFLIFFISINLLSVKGVFKLFLYLFGIIVLFTYLYNYSKDFEQIITRSLSIVVYYIEYGEFYDYSAADTLTTYKLPDSMLTFLFGNSDVIYRSDSSNSDVAFVQWLFGQGIFYCIIISSLFFILVYYIKSFDRRLAFVLFLTFLSSFKGNYIFSKVFVELIFLFFWCAIVYSDKRPITQSEMIV